MQAFSQNIEQIILEHFDNAKKSIVIVVAWFTNEKIIQRLIELRRNKGIEIQILVDNNTVNDKYFYKPYSATLLANGIKIKEPQSKKFNHNKFSIIDNEILITGSYNYTNRANKNLENIVIKKDNPIANYYFRIFKFLAEKDYIDANIEILFDDFEFSNKLISTYYPFSSRLMSKLKNKITLGYCFTHENGLHNEISYEPGLIFNPKYKLHKELKQVSEKKKNDRLSNEFTDYALIQEFKLPITKELIINFKAAEINNYNYQTIREAANFNNAEIDYVELGNDFIKTEAAIKDFYTRKFSTIYSRAELIELLQKKIDIITEDYIWINNFAPFINDTIVEEIYKKTVGSEIL